jgi:hypothetical protein
VVRQCMGHKVDRETGARTHCGKPAMHGQTKCRSHGGASSQAKAAAEKRVERAKVERQVAALGLVVPKEVDPATMLLDEVAMAAGYVNLLAGLVEREGEDGLTQWGVGGRTESAYWSMLTEQRKMLLNAAKACIAAGIAERQVRLAEDQGRLLADVVRTIVTGLGRDLNDPEVRRVVEPALRLVPRAA